MTDQNNNDKENEVTEDVEETNSEHHKQVTPPIVTKYTRPPAFQKSSTFSRWNQNSNNFKSAPRRSAGRWR